jgi:hypothetical protein
LTELSATEVEDGMRQVFRELALPPETAAADIREALQPPAGRTLSNADVAHRMQAILRQVVQRGPQS